MPEVKKRILLIEDDETIRSMYKTKFEAEGYEVLTAANGLEGLKKAEEDGKMDIVLLDIMMPQLDGFSVLSELKNNKKLKDMPVVMLTNLGTEEDMEKGKKMGAAGYIVKSNFTPSQLSEKIKEYLK